MGLGDPVPPYAAGVTATSPPPESGWGAPGVTSPQQRKRTPGAAERPPSRGGAVQWTTRAGASPVGRSARPTFAPPGVQYCPALRAKQSLSWGYVNLRCARALASTYPSRVQKGLFGRPTGSRLWPPWWTPWRGLPGGRGP